jgi:diguanylate cyclase (GGDEF)-like protein/PAS domain S-box-containing protein
MRNDNPPSASSHNTDLDEALYLSQDPYLALETIDVNSLFTKDVSTSGSFDLRSVRATIFGKLMEAQPVPALLLNQSGKITFANQACSKIGCDSDTLPGRFFTSFFRDPIIVDQAKTLLTELFERRRALSIEGLIDIDGNSVWCRMHFRVIRAGVSRSLLLIVEDISTEKRQLLQNLHHNEQLKREVQHRKAAERQLRQTVARLTSLLDATPDIVYFKDSGGKNLLVNKAFERLTGRKQEVVLGARGQAMTSKSLFDKLDAIDRTVLGSGKPHCMEEIWSSSVETNRYFETIRFPVFDEQDEIIGLGGISRDITGRKRAEEERERLISELTKTKESLQFQATHDGLSGLLNRVAVLDVLRRELSRADREDTPLSVIMADVDYFKQINDQHGHLTGDIALREIAKRIRESVRDYDSVGRYGGDEFLVVLPGCDRVSAEKMAERLRRSFSQRPIKTKDQAFNITLSLGVTYVETQDKRDADFIVQTADEALFRAKKRGRNQVEVSC